LTESICAPRLAAAARDESESEASFHYPRTMQWLVALDLGSGSTKMEVMDRDAGGSLTLHQIERRQCLRGVGLKHDLESNGGSLSAAVVEELIAMLGQLLALAAAQQPVVPQAQLRCAAVATAAFREAANGEAVCAQVQSRLGLAVQIVNQTEEARLGFLSAVALLARTQILAPSSSSTWVRAPSRLRP
jgi:exopolyphosphatase/guanosine-5'-triphosphate,3'-diphosphate pyrophosphatase